MTSPTPLTVQSTPTHIPTPSIPLTVISTLPTVPTSIPASITSSLTTVPVSVPPSTSAIPTFTPSDVVVVASEAILTLIGTTVTAYEVAGQTDQAILGFQTITFRGAGVDVGNGQTVSLGADDIEDKTTSALFSALPTPLTITVHQTLPGPYSVHSSSTTTGIVPPESGVSSSPSSYTSSSLSPTLTLPGPLSSLVTTASSLTTAPGPETSLVTTAPGPVTNVTPVPSVAPTAQPSAVSAAGAAPTLSAGRAMALLAGLGGLAAYAL